MKLKLKGHEVEALDQTIKTLLDKLPFNQRWKKRGGSQNLRIAAKELAEERQKIFDKYKDEKLQNVPDAQIPQANAELRALLNEEREVEIDSALQFGVNDLQRVDAKMNELELLEQFELIKIE